MTKPTIMIFGNGHATKVEIKDVEFFSAEEWGKEVAWRLSGPDGGPWFVITRSFLELAAKLAQPENEEVSNRTPTSVEFLK